MDAFLSAGILLGLSAGFSPGPLTTLVITHSMQHGLKEGLKVALAPFITDVPIIVLSVFALAKLREFDFMLGVVSILGACFLMFLSYKSFKTAKIDVNGDTSPKSLGKGTLVNFLSPNPYLFWLTVGAPAVIEAWAQSPTHAAGFIGGFYSTLIGGKISIALIAARSRAWLSGKAYGYVMKLLGSFLAVFALFLFRDGLSFFALL